MPNHEREGNGTGEKRTDGPELRHRAHACPRQTGNSNQCGEWDVCRRYEQHK